MPTLDAHREAEWLQEKEYERAHLREQEIEAKTQKFLENPEMLNELIGDYINEKDICDTYDRLLHAVLTTPYYKTVKLGPKKTEFAITPHIKHLQNLAYTAAKHYATTVIDKKLGNI